MFAQSIFTLLTWLLCSHLCFIYSSISKFGLLSANLTLKEAPCHFKWHQTVKSRIQRLKEIVTQTNWEPDIVSSFICFFFFFFFWWNHGSEVVSPDSHVTPKNYVLQPTRMFQRYSYLYLDWMRTSWKNDHIGSSFLIALWPWIKSCGHSDWYLTVEFRVSFISMSLKNITS